MRTIKFKAWDKKNKCWLFDFRLHPDGLVMAVEHPKLERNRLWRYENSRRLVKDIELIQFTGLKDKNGKEIYEGDIVRFRNHPKKEQVGEVCYTKSACFVIKTADDFERSKNTYSTTYFHNINYAEVIGNIYENPELLK